MHPISTSSSSVTKIIILRIKVLNIDSNALLKKKNGKHAWWILNKNLNLYRCCLFIKICKYTVNYIMYNNYKDGEIC